MIDRELSPIRVTGKMLTMESVSCTGKQLGQLLQSLAPWVGSCNWYLLDIQTNNRVPSLAAQVNHPLCLTHVDLDALCDQVDQFLSGIFLAVPAHIRDPRLFTDAVTEDEPSADLGDAIVEIRAFDTSYFEIYTADPDVGRHLQKQYPLSAAR